MRVRYFAQTDTPMIEFRDVPVAETRDRDVNTTADIDGDGNVCPIRLERASERAGIRQLSYERIAA